MNVKFFVITHKPLKVKLPENYIPVKVGSREDFNDYISDSTGDNISSKNSNYCELTAIYWIWKNYELPDYIGICHYRRYFVKGIFSRFFNYNDVKRIMKKHDIILPFPYHLKKDTVWDFFVKSKSCGKEEDLEILRDLIKKDYNDYYDSFIKVMSSKKISYCNMAVFKKKDFIAYCSWLFPLLEKYEKKVDLTGYNREQLRIYGFMSEFLLNVWVINNKLDVSYRSMMMIEEKPVKSLFIKSKTFLRKLAGFILKY